MSAKKQTFDQSGRLAKSFKSPLFLAMAICMSLVFVAVVITSITMGVAIPAILALIFSGVATLCAWLLFGTSVTHGKLIGLRLYLAYRKIMNSIALGFVIILGALIVGGCVLVASMSGAIEEQLIPMLEEQIKPELENIVDAMNDLEEEKGNVGSEVGTNDALDSIYDEETVEISDEDYEEAFGGLDDSSLLVLKIFFGVDDVDDFKAFIEKPNTDSVKFAENVLANWDNIIELVRTDFMTVAIYVAIAYVVAVVAMFLISSALKRTSKYIRALAEGRYGKKKAPFIVSFIGGGVAAIGGIAVMVVEIGLFGRAPFMGISSTLTAAILVLFAVFFKQMGKEKVTEAPVAVPAAEAAPVAEVAPAVEAAPDTEVHAEETPAEETPAEETPAEETPAEEAPVEE